MAAMAAVSENSSPPASAARAASHTRQVASSADTAMLAQWCLTAWYMAIGRPNCSRTLAYSAACSVHSRATPTASAATSRRLRSTRARRAPGRTSQGEPVKDTRAERRVGSRLAGTSTDTPSADRSTTATSSPTGTTKRSARPPPSTTPAEPDAASPDTVTSPPRATAPATEPSARPGSRRFWASSGAADAITADVITVGTNGPGPMARPISSTRTTSSGRPKPEPPWTSDRCRPNQPSPATSSQKAGRSSVSASSRARAAPRASRLASSSEAVSAKAL